MERFCRVNAAILALAFLSGWPISAALPAAETAAPALQAISTPGWRLHDPSSIVGCGGTYWLFATGMGVRALHSRDLLTWEVGRSVFSQPPAWTREIVPGHRGFFWAPDVVRVNRRYLLYYSVSTWGKNTSAIGLASTASLDPADSHYRWKDEGLVIRSTTNDHFNAIDPGALLDSAGRLWLAFGSFWSGIKLVELDPATGRRLQPDLPPHSLAYHDPIEAPCLHQHGAYHYLFVNWGVCCRGTNSTYEIRVGRSAVATGPYLDRDGKDMLQGGGSLLLGTSGRFIGPGHAGILTGGDHQLLSCHFYDGAAQGRATLGLARLHWTADGWPALDSRPVAALPARVQHK